MRGMTWLGVLAGLLLISAAPPCAASALIPPGVEPERITAVQWELPRNDGMFRADGSWARDGEGGYISKPGDRLEVEYRDGLQVTFFNVGALGGRQFESARIDLVREFLSAGVEAARSRKKASVGDTSQPAVFLPADKPLASYTAPLHYLAFTGGPAGTFTQTGGYQRSDGPISGQIVKEALDGQHYIELRPLYIRVPIDDPEAFMGWPGEDPLGTGSGGGKSSEDAWAARVGAYSGRVAVELPKGTRGVLGEESGRGMDDQLPVGTALTTGADGVVELRFADDSVCVMAPHSRVVLRQRGVFGLSLSRGRARVASLNTEGGTEFRVALSRAVLAGQKAEWVMQELGGESRVAVLSGGLTVSVPGTADVAELLPGQEVVEANSALRAVAEVDVEPIRREWKSLQKDTASFAGLELTSLPAVLPGAVLALVGVVAGLGIVARRRASVVRK